MSEQLDSFLQGSTSSSATGTLVMSTGVIGQLLPIKRILAGITASTATLGTSYSAWLDAAKAFMTTDTFPKLRTKTFELGGTEVRMVGIDKGAGMIHPNMGPPHATLLGMIATDATVSPAALQSALTYAVDRSFNSISVDGDMSTNDTIVALANGASGAKEVTEEGTPAEYTKFRDELTAFAAELAQLVVRDGEGAEKFVKVTVNVRHNRSCPVVGHADYSLQGAPSYEGAHKIASTVSTSALVKCALHGQDANWGRILCAVGYSQPGFEIEPTKVSVSFVPVDGSAELKLLVNGEPEQVDEARASEILKEEDLEIKVELGLGEESATYWTCDLSHEYISINAGQFHELRHRRTAADSSPFVQTTAHERSRLVYKLELWHCNAIEEQRKRTAELAEVGQFEKLSELTALPRDHHHHHQLASLVFPFPSCLPTCQVSGRAWRNRIQSVRRCRRLHLHPAKHQQQHLHS